MLETLNAAQKVAATVTDGAHLVLAGPGTGKTTTLLARHAWLRDQGVPGQAIFTISFTRAAADEIRQRLGQQGVAEADLRRWPIGTFHALALRLMRADPAGFGLPPELRLCDEADQRRILNGLRFRWDEDAYGPLTEVISACKDRLLTAGELVRLAAGPKRNRPDLDEGFYAAAQPYALYQEALKQQGLLDFGDLIMLFVRRLQEDEALAARLAEQVQHLLVDEVQDVNLAQIAMIRLMVARHGRFWAVGDEDQSLYAWRSAHPDYLLRFVTHHPGAVLHRLQTSHRAGPGLLAAANALIRNNRRRHEKALTAAEPRRFSLILNGFRFAEAEIRWLVTCLERLAANGVGFDRVAILYRLQVTGQVLEGVLREHGWPMTLMRTPRFWRHPAARGILAATILMAEPGHRRARALLPESKRGSTLLDKLPALAMYQGQERQAALRRAVLAGVPRDPEGGTRGWHQVASTAARLLERKDPLLLLPAAEGQQDPGEVSGGGLTLSTIHSAKGREWDYVFLPALEEGILPAGEEDLEEERRVAYVGLTRARRAASLSWAQIRDASERAPSRFLKEILAGAPADCVDWRGEGRLDVALARKPEKVPIDKDSPRASKPKPGRRG